MNIAMDLYKGLNLNTGRNQSSITGGKISNCGGAGVYVGAGVPITISNLEIDQVGLSGIHFEGDSSLSQLKERVSEMQQLAAVPGLEPIYSELMPLLTAIKEELEKPRPSKPSLQERFVELNEFLVGVNQGLVASGIFVALQALAEQAHIWVK